MEPVYETSIRSLPLVSRGKVRDIYAVGGDRLLIVTTDRLSAFDVVMPDPVPGKGAVLSQLSAFWFAKLAGVIPNSTAKSRSCFSAALRREISGLRCGTPVFVVSVVCASFSRVEASRTVDQARQ
jgi:phosphoribosylaminoimidazole-succinocarboxamide synthase